MTAIVSQSNIHFDVNDDENIKNFKLDLNDNSKFKKKKMVTHFYNEPPDVVY